MFGQATTNIYTFRLKTGLAEPDGLQGLQLEPTAPKSDQASPETTGNDLGK